MACMRMSLATTKMYYVHVSGRVPASVWAHMCIHNCRWFLFPALPWKQLQALGVGCCCRSMLTGPQCFKVSNSPMRIHHTVLVLSGHKWIIPIPAFWYMRATGYCKRWLTYKCCWQGTLSSADTSLPWGISSMRQLAQACSDKIVLASCREDLSPWPNFGRRAYLF